MWMFKGVKSLNLQGWQLTSILKEHLCLPDPTYQLQTIALDSRVLNSLSLRNPSVRICMLTTWVPRREITSIYMTHIKSLWRLSLRILFGEYKKKKTCQFNNEKNHMAVTQIFPKCKSVFNPLTVLSFLQYKSEYSFYPAHVSANNYVVRAGKRPQVWGAPTWQLTRDCKSSYRESSAPFWFPQGLDRHKYRQTTYTQKIGL